MKKVHFAEIKIFDKEKFDLKPEFEALTDNSAELKNLKLEIMPSTSEFPEEMTVATLRLDRTADEFVSKILKKVDVSDDSVDENAVLYIRLDKSAFFDEKSYKLTESGNCIHVKANLAAYPAKRNKGLEILHSL